MKTDDFNQFCDGLLHTTHVVQWGSSDVWKIGGKVFAIGSRHVKVDGEPIDHLGISFKVSEIGFEVLRDTPDCRPAPYLASRGMKWIQWYGGSGIDGAQLQDYIANSYRLVSLGLTKKLQRELGHNQGE